jgi:hypothetical protein
MFIDPMNGPFKIRLGVIFRPSSQLFQHTFPALTILGTMMIVLGGRTQLCKSLVDNGTHLQGAHAPLIVDQQD